MVYSKKEIVAEYNKASSSKFEYQKVKWGSQAKMTNRMKLAMRELPFGSANSWLDVGCGTGAFQAIARKSYPQVNCVAIDISPNLLKQARGRLDTQGTHFCLMDFMDFVEGQFDIITCIGVLQKTNMDLNGFFLHATKLLKPSGALFVDTKNKNWEKFKDPGFLPEETIQWFDVAEIVTCIEKNRLSLIKVKGYLPGKDQVVEPDESHTIFLIASKNAI